MVVMDSSALILFLFAMLFSEVAVFLLLGTEGKSTMSEEDT